ncbi:MAG: tetratricopeptide repeat protein [Actinomycetota bacterium]|nr:tetratricopeptide repeat protein [Actinomycetota bacterium]
MTDVTDATFERDVLERSVQVPVVVDLWAEWCGPCRTLGPILERVIGATQGKVELAKVDVDRNPMVAASFGVQSIPAVFALKDRQVVDSFVGAVPEPAVQEFVDRLAPVESEADRLVARGDEVSVRRALELDPQHTGAVVALAELLVDRGDREGALELLARVPETAEVRRVAALARVGTAADGDGDVEARLDRLLERVKADEEARKEFVDLLEVLGPNDPRTPQYRRALASRLY